jgi:transaldolase / glucose-6-phosphate isomerase
MDTKSGQSFEIGKHQKYVDFRVNQLQKKNFAERLWKKDEALFIKKDLQSQVHDLSMGWLNVTEKMLTSLHEIEDFCIDIKTSGFKHVVLLGMGGSSLAPFVFQKTFKSSAINFLVLDSTEPEILKKIENEIDILSTLFIVSSKSGSTIEVMAFYKYFFSQISSIKGNKAGENFIAITDEASPLANLAKNKKFRKTFINFSDIGGRFSALSYFGLVPAALMGINVRELLMRTQDMVDACGPNIPVEENPGIMLGAAIAELANRGCDKLTYLLPAELSTFGLWLEQLIAESTGKAGKGILPLNGYPLADLNTYGNDRLFVQYGFWGAHDNVQSERREDLISIDQPLINIRINDILDLGKEFFRWEIATATAGSILGINPFNQPNVEQSKKCTGKLLKNLEDSGKLPQYDEPFTENSVNYYASQKAYNAKLLLENFLSSAKAGDYVTIQAYLPEEPEVEKQFAEIQRYLQTKLKLAVSIQYGPRYLHSTGQYHKGGPDGGIFIQFTCSSNVDVQIPGHPYTFGLLKRAQVIGDREALISNNKRVILVDLGENFVNALKTFKSVIEGADIQGPLIQKQLKKRLKNQTFIYDKLETTTEQKIEETPMLYLFDSNNGMPGENAGRPM